MIRALWPATLSAFVFVVLSNTALSAVTLKQEDKRYVITDYLILEDKTGTLTIEDILNPQTRANQTTRLDKVPQYTSSTLWIQIPVENIDNDADDWTLILTTDIPEIIQLFAISNEGKSEQNIRKETTGMTVPFSERPVAYRFMALPVHAPKGQPITCWLRVQGKFALVFETHLISNQEFRLKDRREQTAFALYYGMAGVMILYNLVLAVFLRSKAYLYYVIYIFCLATYLATLNGITLEYVLGDHPYWNLRLSLVSAAFALLTALQFTRYFLETSQRFRKWNYFLIGLMLFAGVYVFTSSTLEYRWQNIFGRLLTIVVCVSIFSCGVSAYRSGYKPARYFLLAWGFVLVGATLFALPGLGLWERNFLTRFSIQIGSALEMILLSVALSDRINTLRYQRDIAEAKTKSLDRELRIARDIQLSLLPTRTPDLSGLTLRASYIPARVVGGDYYDFHNISKTQVGIIIADAAGHGIPAALIASMLKIAFSNQRDVGLNPAQVIRSMDEEMKGKYQDQYISAGYALVDSGNMTLQYATAGHPPAIVYRPGHGCIEIESRGRLLGWQDDLQILPGKIDIRPGDRILLYTDGVIEARNPHEELFGIERVSEFLDKTKNDDAQQFLDDLRITLLNWIHPRPSFEDDVTMVVIDVEKSS